MKITLDNNSSSVLYSGQNNQGEQETMDDAVIRTELQKCEKRKAEMTERYNRDMEKVEAEIKVYRNLLRIVEGKERVFSKWLEDFMRESRFTNKDLADVLGMSDATIKNWLNGMLPDMRLAGEIGRKLCDLASNSISYDDMMEMIMGGRK